MILYCESSFIAQTMYITNQLTKKVFKTKNVGQNLLTRSPRNFYQNDFNLLSGSPISYRSSPASTFERDLERERQRLESEKVCFSTIFSFWTIFYNVDLKQRLYDSFNFAPRPRSAQDVNNFLFMLCRAKAYICTDCY